MKNALSRVVRHLYQGAASAPYATRRAFDLHVGCAAEAPPSPYSAHEVRHLCLEDDPTVDWLAVPGWSRAVLEAAEEVSDIIAMGGTALVTCWMGWNRSGLVVALALCQLGFSPRRSIGLVQAARGKNALSNRAFVASVLELGRSS